MQIDKQQFEVATWIGRRQAFGLIASKISVADASCLKHLREHKQYKSAGLTWDEFCVRHIGISKTHADRIISQLDEFGAAYFALSQIIRIPAEAFRAIAPAVSEHSIQYNGQTIPISKENGRRIAEVIKILREETAQLRNRLDPPSAPPRLKDLKKLRRRFDVSLTAFAAIASAPLHPDDRAEVAALLGSGLERLQQLSQAFHHQ